MKLTQEQNDRIGIQIGQLDLQANLDLIRIEQGDNMTRNELRLLHEGMCEDARRLMADKNVDYATESDIFRNFRMFGELGILVRMSDKLARLRSLSENGSIAVKSESLNDTVLDLINYAVLYKAYVENTKPLSSVLQSGSPQPQSAMDDIDGPFTCNQCGNTIIHPYNNAQHKGTCPYKNYEAS